ncbi:MAG: LysR family transcriptional regulator [Microbacterium sp.]|uniref:LysR family transcriptional regulator n=1 Tax=Microbacterium sp. TaxID=51671 RepID=UPI001AD26FE1|nr:LysR family transcriptional regulator [Microbacterium sp.]MBN9176819.1 LysR family transcriptional regulator [Microbacterium sp.]
MELRQLEYFLSVAEEGHFTRAAALCGVSQSGLSSAIRSLEDELGVELLARTTRSVQLTESGRALLPFARQALTQISAGRDAVLGAAELLTGSLHVGAEQCLGVVDPCALLERFHARFPAVDIHYTQAGSQELAAGVRSGQLDIAFVAATDPAPGCRRIALGSRPLVVVVHPADALAGESEVSWEHLAGREFVDFRPIWGARRLADAAFAARGLERRVRISVDDVHTVLEFVDHGLGIAIVPQHVSQKPEAARLRVLDLPERDRPEWTVSALLGAHAGAAASRFVRLIEQPLAEPLAVARV